MEDWETVDSFIDDAVLTAADAVFWTDIPWTWTFDKAIYPNLNYYNNTEEWTIGFWSEPYNRTCRWAWMAFHISSPHDQNNIFIEGTGIWVVMKFALQKNERLLENNWVRMFGINLESLSPFPWSMLTMSEWTSLSVSCITPCRGQLLGRSLYEPRYYLCPFPMSIEHVHKFEITSIPVARGSLFCEYNQSDQLANLSREAARFRRGIWPVKIGSSRIKQGERYLLGDNFQGAFTITRLPSENLMESWFSLIYAGEMRDARRH